MGIEQKRRTTGGAKDWLNCALWVANALLDQEMERRDIAEIRTVMIVMVSDGKSLCQSFDLKWLLMILNRFYVILHLFL